MGYSCILSRRASPIELGQHSLQRLRSGPFGSLRKLIETDKLPIRVLTYPGITLDVHGNIPYFRVVDPLKLSCFFVVSMVAYIYAVPLQGRGRNNSKDAEVATSCPVDKRSIPSSTCKIHDFLTNQGVCRSVSPP